MVSAKVYIFKKTLYIDPVVVNMKKNTPAPGTYGHGICIHPTGHYCLSTISNSRAQAWSPNKKRFVDPNYHNRDLPGPGNYNPSDYSNGLYKLSTHRNCGNCKIPNPG